MRPKTASCSTYKDDYQNPKNKPKAKNQDRPKTAAKKKAENTQEALVQNCLSVPLNPMKFQVCSREVNQPSLGNSRLVISANCVHVNVFMPNQMCLSLPSTNQGDKNAAAEKGIKNDKAKVGKNDDFWKVEKKNYANKCSKGAKLFEPPWGYKGHQPRPASSSDPKCCEPAKPKDCPA